MAFERIQKIMAQAGIASRRKCEELIKKGLVKVNGRTAKLGDKADLSKDQVKVRGKPIKKEKRVYILLNKPRKVLCSVKDKFGKKTVIDLIGCKEKIFPVGRLDFDSEGLMILTNDGDFANRIIHPRYNIKKSYKVFLDKTIQENDIRSIRDGVKIDDRKVNVFDLRKLGQEVEMSIHEGRKHIIKRLFGSLGYKVVGLKRTAIGGLKLDLNVGEYAFVEHDWLKKNIFMDNSLNEPLQSKNQKVYK